MTTTPQHFLEKIREAKEKQLTELDLSNHRGTHNKEKLTEIPAEVFELEWLEVLNLSGYELTTLPEAIARLQQLTTLVLSSNQLTTLPEAIARLTQITTLDLRDNKLTTLPQAITHLQQLTTLNLSYNQLTTLPEAITRLQQLTTLNLSFNKLTILPEAIADLQQLTYLDLSDNPIEKPPPVVVRKGLEAIKDYLRQLKAEGTDYLYEAKLLIVGEAGAGKTTLAKKIENKNYQLREEDSTKGIEVTQWRLSENEREFRVNIWDFGGQEIYHATHQFFLIKRSLYVLVADTRNWKKQLIILLSALSYQPSRAS